MTTTARAGRAGRRPAATRDDVVDTALDRYLRGHRVDVRAIAAELGLGRTTIYRWFGSRDVLLGEVLARATDPARPHCEGQRERRSKRRARRLIAVSPQR